MKIPSATIPLCAATLLMAAAALCVELATIHFVDTAAARGVDEVNTYGGKTKKDYILETTGNGVAIFDYDGDGANDLLFVNGTTFDAKPSGPKHVVQLYHNDGQGNFTDVSAKAGFTVEDWGQGVCVGDYDNDGRPDLADYLLRTQPALSQSGRRDVSRCDGTGRAACQWNRFWLRVQLPGLRPGRQSGSVRGELCGSRPGQNAAAGFGDLLRMERSCR